MACVALPTRWRATTLTSSVVASTPTARRRAALSGLRTTPNAVSPLPSAAWHTAAPVNPAPKTTTSTLKAPSVARLFHGVVGQGVALPEPAQAVREIVEVPHGRPVLGRALHEAVGVLGSREAGRHLVVGDKP